jgi:hypothetical protein
MADRKTLLVAAVALAAYLAAVMPAQAGFTVHEVAVDDPPGAPAFAFTPDSINTTLPDGRVHWERGTDGDAEHGIRQDAGLFNLDPTFGVIDHELRFSAGKFGYFCPIHGSPGRGMDGVVRVAPSFDSDPPSVPAFTVRWAWEESRDTGGRFDVRFRRQGATGWTLWKNDTTGFKATFGVDDKPVRVVDGRVYEFQARSEKLNKPKKRSGWSPVMVAP